MKNDLSKLSKRLNNLWEKPDFALFFGSKFKKQPHLVKKGTILFNEGDQSGRLFFIKEGFIKLYRLSQNGKETTAYLYGPGTLLGVRALTSKDEAHKHTCEALTDMQLITISRKEYIDALSSNPEYIIDLLHIFISRLNYTERRLEGFIATDTSSRVASFLSDCMRRFCKENFYKNQVTTLPIKLTHQQIAEFVGALRETVTVSMNKLEKMGIIKLDRGKITILDVKKLNEYSPH